MKLPAEGPPTPPTVMVFASAEYSRPLKRVFVVAVVEESLKRLSQDNPPIPLRAVIAFTQ